MMPVNGCVHLAKHSHIFKKHLNPRRDLRGEIQIGVGLDWCRVSANVNTNVRGIW